MNFAWVVGLAAPFDAGMKSAKARTVIKNLKRSAGFTFLRTTLQELLTQRMIVMFVIIMLRMLGQLEH